MVDIFTPLEELADDGAYRIVRVGPKNPLYFFALNVNFAGVMTHHWSGRTRLCSKDDSCLACDAGAARRWQGYIFGQSQTHDRVAVVHVTKGAADQLESWMKQSNKDLYGRLLCFKRAGTRKGRIQVTVHERKCETHPIRPMDELRARIRTIYKTVGFCCSPETQIA